MNFHSLLLTNIGTTNSVITVTTNRYGLIITVGGDFSHTSRVATYLRQHFFTESVINTWNHLEATVTVWNHKHLQIAIALLLLLYGLNTRYVIHCDSEESQLHDRDESVFERYSFS